MIAAQRLLAYHRAALDAACPDRTGGSLLFRQPTLSRTHLVFVCAGDLWIAERDGGEARRLTSHPGRESDPHFSPDGTLIAFTGEYDGNVDVYVMPAEGGVPRRVTYHPDGNHAAGWTPDGKQVLFASGRNNPLGHPNRLYTMAPDGVWPEPLPFPSAHGGCFSPDGARLAYLPFVPNDPTLRSHLLRGWKRYRGGMTSSIQIADLSDPSASLGTCLRIEPIPRENGNDFNPMWVDHRIYFLSDRNGPITLFVYDTVTGRVSQVLENAGRDIKSASAAHGAIVYEQFGTLWLLNLTKGASRVLDIRVKGEFPEVRPRFAKVSGMIRAARLSPTGSHAVFEARGEVVIATVENSETCNLTDTPGVAERDPAWSPDGRWIAYFSDESGEYALHIRSHSGSGDVRKVPIKAPPIFFAEEAAKNPAWSPDGKRIAYVDVGLTLWCIDLSQADSSVASAPVRIDTDSIGHRTSLLVAWSPDSRWIAYTKELPNHMRAVFLHELSTGKTRPLTDGMTDARFVAFDRGGDYLYFTASTDVGPSLCDFEMSGWNRRVTRRVYAFLLRKEMTAPFAPTSVEEGCRLSAVGCQWEEGPAFIDSRQPTADSLPTRIDLEGIEARIIPLPIPARNYTGMEAGKAGTLFLLESDHSPGSGTEGRTLYRFDLETRQTEKLLDCVSRFALSHDGEKMLYRQGERWAVAATMPSPPPDAGTLKLDAMEVRVDPRAEWRQMYREACRLMRDAFYDPGYHGVDLKALEEKHEPYLEYLVCRDDLDYLFAEMFGELSVSHLFIFGGDRPEVKRVPVGLLGADYRLENGRYRIVRVYRGDPWDETVRGPLAEVGRTVEAGEYLLAVNGREIRSSDNLYRCFEGLADKSVRLRVGPDPEGAGSRDVTVAPIESERELRYFNWIEENRRRVEEMSGGRVGYLHLLNTSIHGYESFHRYYYAQSDKEGLVIDERFNHGGAGPDQIINTLRRPLAQYWAVRTGKDYTVPFAAVLGPKAMIINELALSGGDNLPWLFRRAGLGPLIGKRTWGGEVGTNGPFYFPLIDGGRVCTPNFAFYTPEGEWEIENHGVAPDIEVELDPLSWRAGRDLQLEMAVGWVLEEIEKRPVPKPKRPPFPNYHRGAR